MKVAAYTHLHRSYAPTGVGQHLIRMVGGLRDWPGVDLTVIAPRAQLDEACRIPAGNPLSGIPARGIPLDRRCLEAMWQRLNLPKIDRWCSNADWVYTPSEAYVATRRPRLAVTVHDMHAFEPDLPWSGTPAHLAFRRRWAEMFQPIIRRADRILAVSAFTERRLVELLGIEPRRIAVVGNGVDPAYFDPPSGAPADELAEPYVLVVGGLTQRKGGDFVLQVAQALHRHMPRLLVRVVGCGEAELERQSAALPNVVLLGFVETGRLVHLLRNAVAMMLLSRYEGFGIPVVEAMAAGAPVIVSRWGALPEVTGDAGVLVDAENADEVVSAIRMLSNDSATRNDLRARGRKRAEDYRWTRCVERLVAALQSP